MALGGGTFLVHNKRLPGTYVNVVSVRRASNFFSDRGYCAIGLELDWGQEKIITLENEDLQKDALKLFGHSFTDEELKPIREIMLNAKTCYIGRLNADGGKKATGTVGGLTVTAKCVGVAGNNISVAVESNIDNEEEFIVITKMNNKEVDRQAVKKASELVVNDFVDFKGETLEAALPANLESGENGKVTAESHSTFLDKIEKYDFNTIGYAGTDTAVKKLYNAFAKRLRDEVGVKIQTVVFDEKANYEGSINVTTKANEDEASFVYWVLGASAGCDVNKSLTNRMYNGEYTSAEDYKQRDLIKSLENGEFVFHEVDGELRVLEDINSFTEFTPDKNDDFSKNQIIRVADQIAKDRAIIFNKFYLGKIQNNEEGRISLWKDFVKHAETLVKLGAIQDYDPEKTVIIQGDKKDEVICDDEINVAMAMQKLYMTVYLK